MLQYLLKFSHEINNSIEEKYLDAEELKQFAPPPQDSDGSYPFQSFFCDYTPRWFYVYSNLIPRLSYYKKIANFIAAGKNIIITGIRGSGKTTLLMQLTAEIETNRLKHYMIAPTIETTDLYLKNLSNNNSILFIDDCFRDTDALIKLLNAKNVQVVCSDRDFNYERQFHKISELNFETVDITEISKEDAQSIINEIPNELKRNNVNTKKFEKDPTLPTLLISTLKPRNYKFLKSFYENDYDAARVFIMVCYVHSCGVPCSFDMVYSFLGDERYSWKEMMEIVHRAGNLIKEFENTNEFFGSFDIDFSLQDYYQCRSRYFAQTIIENIPKGDNNFASILSDFVNYVPPYKICAYDKFKRSGYDADLAVIAFNDFSKGKEYYESCILKDESEYIYQQAAIFFSRIGHFKEAFLWIDRARNLAHYNRFSIDSAYALIYFKANVGINHFQCKEALNILNSCCTSDKRKSIHFITFAKCVLEYSEKHSLDDPESICEYIETALTYIAEGVDKDNNSLQTKNKWELLSLKKELQEAKRNIVIPNGDSK